MEYTKEFMESFPTPKYKYNQDVLVVRGREIEVQFPYGTESVGYLGCATLKKVFFFCFSK